MGRGVELWGQAVRGRHHSKTMNYQTAIQTTIKALKGIDWATVGNRAGVAARTAWTVAQLLAMVVTLTFEMAYENRQQIRQAIVKAVAAFIVTAEEVLKAGQATRNWVERMNDSSAVALKEMPEQLNAVAPIAAPVVAVAKSATAALINWLQLDSVDTTEVAEITEVTEVTEEIEPVSEGFGEQLVRSMDELMALPAATLREMVGTRARYPKAKLVAMVMAA